MIDGFAFLIVNGLFSRLILTTSFDDFLVMLRMLPRRVNLFCLSSMKGEEVNISFCSLGGLSYLMIAVAVAELFENDREF